MSLARARVGSTIQRPSGMGLRQCRNGRRHDPDAPPRRGGQPLAWPDDSITDGRPTRSELRSPDTQRRRLTLVSATALLAAASLAAAGCGGSSSSSDTSTPTPSAATTAPSTAADTSDTTATAPATTAPAAATKVAVVMGKPKEFSLSAVPIQVPAGATTFIVVNKGSILHEMVIVPSAGGAAALRQPDGTASEAGAPGEVPDVKSGGGGQVTVTLPAGRYVLLCNLPGHFAGGMYANLVVK